MKIILKALVGSHLYGLATESSDYDYAGIFVSPTSEVLKIHKPEQTHVSKNPDCTLHEVEKYMRLAAKGNPTLLELLFVPKYEIITFEGELLYEYRQCFLSNHIKDAFGGYAYAQAKKLQKREEEGLEGFNPAVKKRRAKHARHCFRLLRQGKELLETGTLTPILENVEEYFALEELSTEQLVEKFTQEYREFQQVVSMLPNKPDWEGLEAILNRIRRENWS